jgi:dTDP-4-amino-4,6-dideoxygalactose transaminase
MPVFADIEPDYFGIDPADVERRITPKTKAVIPVHLYGQGADLSRLLPLVRRHGLRLIEDCAQAHGARHEGRRLGSFGDFGCYSCYPTKNLGAIGDAGLIVTNDPALAARCRALREYGWNEQRESIAPGMNTRLDELQAAVLRVKLADLDRDNDRRRALAARYAQKLSGIAGLPAVRAGSTHVYHLYVMRSARRDALRAGLHARGVAASVHYPLPVHQMAAYRDRLSHEGLRETERAAREVLSLPMHPELSNDDLDRVAEAVEIFHRDVEDP